MRKPVFALATALAVLMTLEGTARLFMAGLDPTGFDDASWRNAWLRDHAGRGEIFYAFDRFDPSKGWISQAGLRAQPAFAGKTVSTNSLGLRGAREIGDNDDGASPRIIVLGDSFTFGDEVSEDQIHLAVRRATIARDITPVLVGTAFKNKGVQSLLNAISRYMPSPIDRVAYANDNANDASGTSGTSLMSLSSSGYRSLYNKIPFS